MVINKSLDDLISSDSGLRNPNSKTISYLIFTVSILWSLFQLWIASPISFKFDNLIFNSTEARVIHLSFAIFLAFLCYPALKKTEQIPIYDWVLAIAGCFCASYLFIFYEELSLRSGIVTKLDLVAAMTGIILLLEATRRSLGLPMVILVVLFLLYTLFGDTSFLPNMLRHKGHSLNKIASHQWLSTEGVYGIALGVSTSFVFLFVLFGALLDKAGAGNYFIKLAFSLLGHMRGGPAKAAVLASGMTGIISGSSIANTVTTGTFTIPLMKKTGFSKTKAGAIEVAASVNGQIMPPVMGAAAFLMVEYVNIPYTEVIKHAFLPAIISYIALLYMVHLEAVKSDMKALEPAVKRSFTMSMILWGIGFTSLIIFSYIVYNAIFWLRPLLGDYANQFFIMILLTLYCILLYISHLFDDQDEDFRNIEITELPKFLPTLRSGLHYTLPIVLLIWCLMVERFSPGLSAFYATIFMLLIISTQKWLCAIFFKTGNLKNEMKSGIIDLLDGLSTGARNMISIGIATATAGIIVGSISLTGVGQVLLDLIEFLSNGSLIIVLILTAFTCIILGMGLPTTANYIVVASLMAHIVEQLGIQSGFVIPLIAIHLFVFYFGIMADVTPPVGLASFAAAAISGADPIKTGIQAFTYSLRTAALPFFFIYNHELILIGVNSIPHALWVFFYATIAILVFSSAIQGYLLTRNKLYESVILFIISTLLFVPNVWIDKIFPPYEKAPITKIFDSAESLPDQLSIKVRFKGIDDFGDSKEIISYIKIAKNTTIERSLKDFGINLTSNDNKIIVKSTSFNSDATKIGVDFDYEITEIALSKEQPDKNLVYLPAFLLLLIILIAQYMRKKKNDPTL